MFFVCVIRGDLFDVRARWSRSKLIEPLVLERERTKKKAEAVHLTLIEPSFAVLRQIITGSMYPDNEQLIQYFDYYRRVIKSFPFIAEAHAVLGVLLFYDEQIAAAEKSFLNAHALKSGYFWPLYNLGYIYFRDEEFEKATKVLMKAIYLNPDKSFNSIFSSRIYHQIFWPDRTLGGVPINKNLKNGYRNAYELLVLSKYNLQNFDEMFKLSVQAIKIRLDEEGYFYYYAGLAKQRLNDRQESLRYFNKSYQINPFLKSFRIQSDDAQLIGMNKSPQVRIF